jgi:hypothetical protein
MQSGLPVLANINAGNDLADVIRKEQVGMVSEGNSPDTLQRLAEQLLAQLHADAAWPERCRALFVRMFAVEAAVHQVVHGLLDAPVTSSRAQKDEDWESQLSTPVM